ncbi:MAG: hypothetical protein E7Z70_02170 [Thermoplasmata archaeon]|nr:hypothetical protein [Thermoplasmata archaeon]
MIDSKYLAVALIMTILAFGAYAIYDHSGDSDAATTYTYNWTVGESVSETVPGTSISSGSLPPGVSYSVSSQMMMISGTPTVAGSYTVKTNSGYTLSITVTAASSTTNYTVSFSISSGSSYGSLNYSSITVPSGTTFSKSGNSLVFKNGSTTLYTVTPTPKSATSSYTYSFGSWSSTSGTITSAKSITCTFTRTAVVSYSDPVITVGSAGSTITLTSDVSVTWSISTNSSKASLSSTSGTSTTVTPTSNGYITVKAVHNSDSSYYSTKTLNICSLSYNANGGSGAPSTQYYIQSGTGSHSFSPSGTAIYSGHKFVGWGTSSSSTSASSSVSVAYRSTSTVYAIWTTAISISAGSAGSLMTLSSNVSASWSITTYSSKASLSSTSGTSTTVTPSDYGYVIVTAINNSDSSDTATVTLNISRIVYNANGGFNAPATVYYVQTGSSTHTFTLSGTPTKSGYDFGGWGSSSTATSSITTKSVSYRSSATVYAIWTASEAELAFTSYPTSANVTLPTITYRDDGSYVIS